MDLGVKAMAERLSNRTLHSLGAALSVPAYDRAALTPGIVHFGVGNFHRAHQAYYLDALFNAGRAHDWAIVGAGVMPSDARMRDTLARQDYLSTLVEQEAASNRARVIGPMTAFLPVGDTDTTIAALADPAIRIVSLTVTEGGYFVDSNGAFDPSAPAIAADALLHRAVAGLTSAAQPLTVQVALYCGNDLRRIESPMIGKSLVLGRDHGQ